MTLWGIADDDTWLDIFPVARKDAPLLFDVALQAKSAYWSVIGAASPSPSTSASASASSTVNGWTLRWTYANGQQITQIWSATRRTSGSAVAATNVSYNGTIAPSASVNFGFLASWTGTNARPTAFTLNNTARTVA